MHLSYHALAVPGARAKKSPQQRARGRALRNYTRAGCVPRMRNATLLRPSSTVAPAERGSNGTRPDRPPLYFPAGDSSREMGQLFNLRRRPGYYNAAEKAALLRRGKQSPHDELFVDFAGSAVNVRLTAADIQLAV